MTHVVVCVFFHCQRGQFKSLWVSVVSLRSEPCNKIFMSFHRETDYRHGCPHAIKAWFDVVVVKNDVFAPGDCLVSNNKILSKSELLKFQLPF